MMFDQFNRSYPLGFSLVFTVAATAAAAVPPPALLAVPLLLLLVLLVLLLYQGIICKKQLS